MRVRIEPHCGEDGYVSEVHDGMDKILSMSDREASSFIRDQRARHGNGWIEKWFSADVTLKSGKSITVVVGEVRVLDGAVRPHGYRTV